MVNKIILIGNVGKDPEVKAVGSGKVAKFSLATTERWKDQQGQKQERTTWHNCEVWGKLADVVESYVKQGSKLYLEGSYVSDTWQGEDGSNRTSYKVKVREMVMLGGNNRQ